MLLRMNYMYRPVLRMCTGVFIQSPQSQNVIVGTPARFESEHSSTNHIVWMINGGSQTVNSTSLRMSESGRMVHTLSIMGTLNKNGTEVVARAMFLDNSFEDSDPAALLGGSNINMLHFSRESFSLCIYVHSLTLYVVVYCCSTLCTRCIVK